MKIDSKNQQLMELRSSAVTEQEALDFINDVIRGKQTEQLKA